MSTTRTVIELNTASAISDIPGAPYLWRAYTAVAVPGVLPILAAADLAVNR
nr:hypothetical protein [Pseudonocardia alni]